MEDNALKNIDLKQMHDLIDLYKYASIEGERVEFIVYPTKDNKRIITIGLQNGFSRDRDTFVFEDGDKFDSVIYPEILSYFTCDDSLGNWDVVVPENSDATIKGTSETQSGNIVYLDTYNKELFDKLNEKIEDVQEKETYKKEELTNIDKVWDEIVFYAKERRQLQDFYKGLGFSSEELQDIYKLVIELSNAKEINIGKTRKAKNNNEEYLKKLFESEEVLKYGINRETYNKIVNTSVIKKLSNLTGIEKRIRNRLDLNNEEIRNKIEFATSELDKVEFFSLKNGSAHEFESREFIESKPRALCELIEILSNEELYDENLRNQYKDYCYELLDYLERKSVNGKKIVNEKEESEEITFTEYHDEVVDKYDELEDAISLIKGAKLDSERYEIVVDNKGDKVKVRIDLLDGVTRSDLYEFDFTDKKIFDERIKKILDNIYEVDPKLRESIEYVYIPNEEVTKRTLTTTKENNEILVKNAPSKEDRNLEEVVEARKEIAPVLDSYVERKEALVVEKPLNETKEETIPEMPIKVEPEVKKEVKPEIQKEVKHELTKEEKLRNLEKQFSDYLIEQEKSKEVKETKKEEKKEVKEMKEERNINYSNLINSINSSLFNDIDLASFELIIEKYNCNPVDALYKNNLTKDEKLTIIRVLVKENELIKYYNSNFAKTGLMNKEQLSMMARCETILMAINEMKPKEIDSVDRINTLLKIDEITPYGGLLLKNLLNDEMEYIKNEYFNDLFEFNVNKYSDILKKYNGNLSKVNEVESEKDKDELSKLMHYKMQLIEEYNNLLLNKKSYTKEEAERLAKYETRLYKILEIDAKYAPNKEEMIKELKENYNNLVPYSKLMLKALERSNDKTIEKPVVKVQEKEKGLFEIIEREKEEKPDDDLEEIKDAYEEALSYASSDTPAIIEVKFEKDNKKEADVIISNKVNDSDVVIYQRTFDIDKLNNGIMDELSTLYANNNEIKYPIKFNIGSTIDYCLLMIGENRRTFKISKASEEFVDTYKKNIEDKFEETVQKIK